MDDEQDQGEDKQQAPWESQQLEESQEAEGGPWIDVKPREREEEEEKEDDEEEEQVEEEKVEEEQVEEEEEVVVDKSHGDGPPCIAETPLPDGKKEMEGFQEDKSGEQRRLSVEGQGES